MLLGEFCLLFFCLFACFMRWDEWSTDTHKEKLRQITGNYKLEKCLYALWYWLHLMKFPSIINLTLYQLENKICTSSFIRREGLGKYSAYKVYSGICAQLGGVEVTVCRQLELELLQLDFESGLLVTCIF